MAKQKVEGIKVVAMPPQGRNPDAVYKRICGDIEWLHGEGEKETADGRASRARILFYALAGFLEERKIIDHLKMAACYMERQG